VTELVLQAIYSGLALVFGTMRIINLAHGEMVLLAAYVAYACERSLGLDPLVSIPIAVAAVAVAMMLTYGWVSRIRQDRELNSLLLTFGIGIIVTNAILLFWKADIRSTRTSWLQEPVVLGPFYSVRGELVFCAIGLVLIGGSWWWLTRTWSGRALRAVASDRETARLMGIEPRRLELISFVVAGVLAAFAGVALFSVGVIQPSLGASLTIKAFVITVLAGLGSIPGVLVGALLLGVTESLTTTFLSSALQELAGMLLFLIVLFVLPNGLFGSAIRRS